MMKVRPAFPLVIAAPSGAGKTTLARALQSRDGDVVFALSATTRPPRPSERHGVDYHFVDDAGFEELVASGSLIEWAEVHGRRYGTLRSGVEASLAAGRVVVLDIDVQGARLVRQALPGAVLVFVLPPGVNEMRRRLQNRGSGEDPGELARRMQTAREELGHVPGFDYLIVNDDFDDAMRALEAILLAERSRVARMSSLETALAELRTDIDGLMQGSH
jgi:guanylate kinase